MQILLTCDFGNWQNLELVEVGSYGSLLIESAENLTDRTQILLTIGRLYCNADTHTHC